MDTRAPTTEPIGGFFALERPGVVEGAGLSAMWGAGEAPAWSNAGSALAALVRHLRPSTVWLPGHWCPWTIEAVPARARRFYPLGEDLFPREGAVHPSAGDLVLAADMFGRAPGKAWRSFVAAHPDVTFVEDRAQALETGEPPWGDWLIFSPRKLCGVWEGGLLVPVTARAHGQAKGLPPPGPPDPEATLARLAPALLRAEAPDRPELWWPRQKMVEEGQRIGDAAMSPTARALLSCVDGASMAARRRDNFAALHLRLGAHALMDVPRPTFAPLGFPLTIGARRDELRAHLHAAGIFTAIHWPHVPGDDAADRARAAGSLTLPCDHRYGPAEMDRIADAVEAAL